jgi:hypothetical protein
VLCRELFKKEEGLSSQGPGITYNGSEPKSQVRAHAFCELNLFKSEEKRASDVPGAGKYDVNSGSLSQSVRQGRRV